MKEFVSKILKKTDKAKSNTGRSKSIEQEANEVFEKYEKTFKDLARYDRGEKITAAN